MWNQLKETILDVILPRSCLGCGKEGKYVCEKCELFLSEAPNLFYQGNIEQLTSVWEYEGLVKEIIAEIKYKGIFDAVNELVEKAFETREPYIPEDTVITFVPLFKKKENQRGFNQAEIIARKVGEMTGSKVLPLLEKIRDTSSQTELDKVERLENVKDSFAIMQKNSSSEFSLRFTPLRRGPTRLQKIQNPRSHTFYSNVMLVDDVWTSGATMKECAKVLKKSGVKRVFGFTLARVV